MRQVLAVTLYIIFQSLALAQQKPPTGAWRVHLPYFNNQTIDVAGNEIYCGSNSGLFVFNTESKEVKRLSKITGLSDVEVKLIKHHSFKNISVVIYQNTNIDLLVHNENRIINIPDVLNKSIIGTKSINNVFFLANKAYLACSFGVVVIDLDRKQISDSYQNLGPNGTNLSFNDITILNNTIYAASNNAIYKANLNAPNLSDFNFWSIVIQSTRSRFVTNLGSNLLAEVDSVLKIFDGTTFTTYSVTNNAFVKNVSATNGNLMVLTADKVYRIDENQQLTTYSETFKNSAAIDAKGRLCMVDNLYGLTILNPDGITDYIIPNGPLSNTIGKFTYAFDRLWQTGGQVTDKWDEAYNSSKFSTFSSGSWRNFWLNQNAAINQVSDFLEVKKHPFEDKIYLSSYGQGVFELNGEELLNKYDDSNSSLQRFNTPGFTPLRVSGLDFDNNGNLWVSNFGVNKPLSVKTPNGWYSFSVGTILGGNEVGYLTCDDYNNKWVITIREKGILVYNDNGTPANANDDQYKLITKEVGQGALPSNLVYCVSKDLNGEMWIGTSQGLAIISNPYQVFNTKNNSFDARQIIIQTGDYFSIFLGTEIINCIKVDAANRKWIGTRNGVWLVSPDGYTVIHNFTTSNSPLLSNNVLEIGIDESTGEVFFATDKGIIAYMGDATAPDNKFSKVSIYPNPVQPEYKGVISIKGLAENAVVKIADINGNLVYETTANGGFATWNGNSFTGQKASSGVYLVYSSTRNGETTHVGKILLLN